MRNLIKKAISVSLIAVSSLTMGISVFAEGKGEPDTVTAEIPFSCDEGGTVKLEPVSEGAIMPETDTIAVGNGEKGSFKVTYLEPGTYEYIMYQLPIDSKDIDQDKSRYEVSVSVYYDEKDSMCASLVAKNEATKYKPESIKFENKKITPQKKTDNTNTGTGAPIVEMGAIVFCVIAFIVLMISHRKDLNNEN